MTDKATDATLLEEAREHFAASVEAFSRWRADALDDLRFLALDQWPDALKHARENDPNGARPCLVLDKCNQHVRQITHDMRQNRPAIKVRPANERATKETAEVLSGIIRHIEQRSGAEMAYLTAGEYAASIGLGYFRILTEYEGENSFLQEIKIARVHNPFAVYNDPYSTELDGSDSEWCFISERLPKKMFERQFPDAEAVDVDRAEIGDSLEWYQQDSVRIAEYFYRIAKPETLLLLKDGNTAWGDEYEAALKNGVEPVAVVQQRKAQRRRVHWCKHTGSEIIERREFPSSYIPVIPVYGNQYWLDGERRIFGAVRPAKDPQRVYNYQTSTAVELNALAPRAPYIGAEGQFADHPEWDSANTENYSKLEYNPLSIGGVAVPMPQRQQFAGVQAGAAQLLQMAEHDIQASFGQYNASLGAPSNEHSGVAIREKKMEADMGNSHYMGNLALSIEHAGDIIVEMAPRVIDTRRVQRILGEDGSADHAQIDPSTSQAYVEQRAHAQGGKVRKIYNLGVGRYDVVATVGPGYSTKRQEAAEGMVQLAQGNPQVMQLASDLIVRNMDWPGADQIADRLKRAIPPEIRGPDEGEPGADIPPELQARMGQMQQHYEQQLAQAQQIMQQMQQQLGEAQGKAADTDVKVAEMDIKRFEAQTKRHELVIKQQEAEARNQQVVAETEQTQGINEVIAGLAQAQQIIVQSAQALTGAAAAMQATASAPKRIDLVRDAQGRAAGAVVHSDHGVP